MRIKADVNKLKIDASATNSINSENWRLKLIFTNNDGSGFEACFNKEEITSLVEGLEQILKTAKQIKKDLKKESTKNKLTKSKRVKNKENICVTVN